LTRNTGKKFPLGNCTTPYEVLRDLSWDTRTNSQLYESQKISKQSMNYWLNKLLKDGFIVRPYRGIYDITDIGKKILERFTAEEGKNLVRLENMRFGFPIKSDISKLQSIYKDVTYLGKIPIAQDKIEGHSIRIFLSPKNPSVEISCKQKLGNNPYELYYEAKQEVIVISQIFKDYNELELGEASETMKPEWAIPSPFAEALLTITHSSQIRTGKGIINRSKGRNADLEVRDPRHAEAILEMPLRLERLERIITSSLYQSISFL